MNMNITEKVTEKYKSICPFSTRKCVDEAEIRYKINRAVNLGRKTEVDANGNYFVQYHNLKFIIRNKTNAVINMWVLNKSSQKFNINEEVKLQYDLIHRKVPEVVIESKITEKEVKSINIVNAIKNKVSIYKGFLKLIFN